MIDVSDVLNYVIDVVNFLAYSNDTVYCICYDNGKDKRILMKYGVFEDADECYNFISTLKNSNVLEPFPLEKNHKVDYSMIYRNLRFLEDTLDYAYKLEVIVSHQILKQIDDMLKANVFNGKEIIFAIKQQYGLTEDELKEMLGDNENMDFDYLYRYKPNNVAKTEEK